MVSGIEDSEEFSEIILQVREWRLIMSYLVRHYLRDTGEMKKLFHEFQNLVSAALASKTVENADESVVADINDRYWRQIEHFEKFLETYKGWFYNHFYRKDDEVLKYVEKINSRVVREL